MEWWIFEGDDRSQRSYSKEELADHPDVGPDTRLQSIEGSLPVRAGDIPELRDLFDEEPDDPDDVTLTELLNQKTPESYGGEQESGSSASRSSRGGFLHERRQFSLRDLVFDPIEFFRRLNPDGSNVFALFVALLAGMIGESFRVTYAFLIPGYSIFVEQFVGELGADPVMSAAVLSAYCLLLVPLIILVGAIVVSGLVHLALVRGEWDTQPFDATFKITCYSSIGLIGGLIPWAGMPLGMLWALVLLVIGLIVVQGIPPRRAAVISLAPGTLVLIGLLVSRVFTV